MTTDVFPGSRYFRIACGKERTGSCRAGRLGRLDVVPRRGVADDDDVAVRGHVVGGKASGYGDLEGLEQGGHRRIEVELAAGDAMAGLGEQGGERDHRRSADADEVDARAAWILGNHWRFELFVEISAALRQFRSFGVTVRQERSRKMRQSGKTAGLAIAAFVAGSLAALAQDKAPTAKAPDKPPAAAAAPGKGAAVAAPKIEVIPETKEAGTVAKGQMIESVFVVKNNGAADLVISDARPGCGCTVASFDKIIKPGGEGKVLSSVDTKNFSGPITKSILLVSNDPDRPQLNLFIKATVKPFVDVLPTGVCALLRRQGRLGVAGRRPRLRGEDLQADRRRDGAAVRQGRAHPGRREGQGRRTARRSVQAPRLRDRGRAGGAPERPDPHRDRRHAAAEPRDPGLGLRPLARLGHAGARQLRQLHRGQGRDHAQHHRDEQQAGPARSRSRRPRSASPGS